MPKGAEKDDGNNIFPMEAVLDYKKHRSKDLFLVRWKGYDIKDSTWEPESNILGPSEDMEKTMKRLKQSYSKRKSPATKSESKTTDPAPLQSKKIRGVQRKASDSEEGVEKEEIKPSHSLNARVTRLSVGKSHGDEELTATLEFDNGETTNVNINVAKEKYTQELLDFLLSRVRFRNRPEF